MSKRQCPFEYDLLPQLKVRMDQKHYDSRHGTSMARIHDKTLRMLFNGAKKLSKVNNELTNKSASVSDSSQNAKNISEFCTHCNELNVIECQCSFCDKWMCKSCSASCLDCHELFCSSHFIKLCQHGDGECVCLNCAASNSITYRQ